MSRGPASTVTRIADAIEHLRGNRETVYEADLIGIGFTPEQIKAHGDDARALHAQRFPNAAA